MKEIIKKFIRKNPVLEKYTRLLMNGKKITKTIPKKKISGTGNALNIHKSALLFNCTFDIIGNDNEIEINESSIFNNVTFFIRGSNHKVKIGKRIKFNYGGTLWMEDNNCEITIGDNSTFEDIHIAATEPKSKIYIGKDCMFANYIDVRTGDSHSIIDMETNQRINYAQDIFVNDHVWVASHVSILKGVHIAKDSVVATRAMVTKPFDESNVLIGGIPAKIIKRNINWDRQRIYK